MRLAFLLNVISLSALLNQSLLSSERRGPSSKHSSVDAKHSNVLGSEQPFSCKALRGSSVTEAKLAQASILPGIVGGVNGVAVLQT